MTPGRRVAAWVAAAGLWAGCDRAPAAPAVIERHHRYGVFRDLVLIPRSEARGGPFFLDRFESTRRDILAWCAASDRPTPEVWPAEWSRRDRVGPTDDAAAARVQLGAARAFARWRFCRLPRFDEWEYAATAGGEYRFPWGDPARVEWANTPQLGLGRVTSVGTFESGRASSGPYDLVGNVAEWTETLAPRFHRDRGWVHRTAMGAASASRPSAVPWPQLTLVAFAPGPTPRLTAGGGFLGASGYGVRRTARTPQIPVLEFCAGEWSDDVGVRVATDPDCLLRELLREPDAPPDEASTAALITFLAMPEHRALFVAAWEGARAAAAPCGALEPILARTLVR